MASTVILGSGIIGLSTAYYLADHQPGNTIHLVDASPTLFASASGYAGGFVADGTWKSAATASLGNLSFAEHRHLADKHNGAGRWGYARTVPVSYDVDGNEGDGDALTRREEETKMGAVPSWLKRVDGDKLSIIGNGEGVAILDPLKLCQFLMEECREAGVHLHHPATALCITTDVRNELASIRIGYTDSSTETELPCTRLLIAAGAWTPRVFQSLFPSAPITIPISSLAGHSLVVRAASAPVLESAAYDKAADEDEKHCHAVYCGPLDNGLSPELYERGDGVIYLAGVNSSTIPLPSLATATESVEASIDQLKDVATQLIGDKIEVVRTGLCFRPITPRGTPIITRVEDKQLGAGPTGDESLPGKPIKTRLGQEGGVFIAAGHGFWGISLSLGTGKVLAEMMQEKRLSADVRELGLM